MQMQWQPVGRKKWLGKDAYDEYLIELVRDEFFVVKNDYMLFFVTSDFESAKERAELETSEQCLRSYNPAWVPPVSKAEYREWKPPKYLYDGPSRKLIAERYKEESGCDAGRQLLLFPVECFTAKEEPMPVKMSKPPAPVAVPVAPAAPVEAVPEPKPVVPRLSASEAEIAAAIEGSLAPREVVGDPNQEALTTVDQAGRSKGRPVGLTTGFPILLAWCYIFQQNEQAPKDGKFTDEDITNWMKAEFPGRTTPAFDSPSGCRNDYNNGRFTKGVRPNIQSHRYDASGEVMLKAPRAPRAAAAEATAETAPAAPAPAAPAKPAAAPAKPAAKPAAVAAKPVAAAPVAKPAAKPAAAVKKVVAKA